MSRWVKRNRQHLSLRARKALADERAGPEVLYGPMPSVEAVKAPRNPLVHPVGGLQLRRVTHHPPRREDGRQARRGWSQDPDKRCGKSQVHRGFPALVCVGLGIGIYERVRLEGQVW